MGNLRVLVLLAVCAVLAPAAGSPASAAEEEAVPLSLGHCLRTALKHNLDLVSARIDPEISEQNKQAAEAEFDGSMTAYAARTEETVDPTDISQTPGSRSNRFQVDYGQTLPFGADYSATLFAGEFDRDVPPETSFFASPTTFASSLSLDFTLPLLRGFGREVTTENLLLARGNLEISREELRRRAQLTIETVERAYWDALATQEALKVAQRALKRAEDLLELNRKKVEVGTLAPIQITQAEAEVAAKQETLIVSETERVNAEDELRRLMAVPSADPMWDRPLLLVDRPAFVPQEIDLEAAVEQALDSRPEMTTARQQLRNEELSERVARKGLRHGLDLHLNYTPSGTDIDEFTAEFVDAGPDGVPDTEDDNYRRVKRADGTMIDALQEIPKLDNRSWEASLSYSLPVGNRAAKTAYRIAELNREKSEVALRDQEQTIRVEVRAAVREVESGIKRVEAARKNVELQEKKLDAEQKKFENGMSTSFEVLTFQNDLADAELSLIRAALTYTNALAALERAKGTLLEARGLSLAE